MSLQTHFFYGLRTDVLGNAYFVADDEVIYLVGNALAIHNFAQHRQRLVRLPDKQKINLMAITPNKKYAALCDTGEKPLISIYDLQTLKKKKLLGIPYESSVKSFACIAFSFDSKYLAVVTTEEQTMLFYNWEKGKVESSLKLINMQNKPAKINLIACNPSDAGIIALGGPYSFKFITATESLWRPYGFSKADNLIITSLVWLNGDRLLAGTPDGRVLYLENGDLKYMYKMSETNFMDLKIKEEYVLQTQTPQEADDYIERQEIRGLVNFGRGFAFALGYGTIVLFEREGAHKYTRRNVYIIPPQVSSEENNKLYEINTISSNPSNDKLLVTTGWSQLFCAMLWGPDLRADPEPQIIDVIGHRTHHGPIGGLSTCIWKSYILTYGQTDQSVRVWDYDTQSLVMVKQYLEDITCIVVHPTGLFCLIGFRDKLRFMSILIDDFLPVQEFPIRSCKIAAFSFGGHLFAAVNGNIIQVYTTMDFHIRHLLKGHTEFINGIVWAQDDSKLVSIGSEGAIYEWNMNTGQRSAEVVLKGIRLNGIVLSADGVTSYCISSDNQIYEIKENSVIRVYEMPDIEPKIIVMGKDDSLMFITYPDGYIASLKHPLQSPVEYSEYHIHCSDVTQMLLTYDEQVLITTGMDGTLCFWKVSYTDGKETALSREILYLDQVLINREDLGEKVQAIEDLQTRMKELETEQTYKMRQIMIQHNEKLREVHQSYWEALQELREKIDKLQEDHTNEINTINVQITKTKAQHHKALRKMEISYDSKLTFEYEKYNKYVEETRQMRESFFNQLEEQAKASKALLEETISKYEDLLREKDLEVSACHEEIVRNVQIHELIKLGIEKDTDYEIGEMRTEFETLLHEERQLVLKLKSEAGVLKHKHEMNLEIIEDFKWQLRSLRDEYIELKSRKEELEKEVADLKTLVEDKDTIIAEKDKNIAEIQLSNEELETTKFVLSHHINELKAQIDPRDREIADLKRKITNIETELLGLNKVNHTKELKLYDLREKLSAAKKEIQHEATQRKKCMHLLRKIRVDVLESSNLIQEPNQLKSMIIKLYHRYSDDAQFQRNYQADRDAQTEFMKQRDHLEQTIALLKKQVTQTNSGGDQRIEKFMEENVMIMSELNALREELKDALRHVGDMESLLGLKGRDIGPLSARNKLEKACHGVEELEEIYKKQILECHQVIIVLREDINLLINKILEKKMMDWSSQK